MLNKHKLGAALAGSIQTDPQSWEVTLSLQRGCVGGRGRSAWKNRAQEARDDVISRESLGDCCVLKKHKYLWYLTVKLTILCQWSTEGSGSTRGNDLCWAGNRQEWWFGAGTLRMVLYLPPCVGGFACKRHKTLFNKPFGNGCVVCGQVTPHLQHPMATAALSCTDLLWITHGPIPTPPSDSMALMLCSLLDT